jgi:hypothetical protein
MSTAYETAQVRFRRPYQAYKTGRVYTFSKGVARSLEMFGKADIVREPVIEFATAPEPDPVEAAVAPIAKAKRGRRKKQP